MFNFYKACYLAFKICWVKANDILKLTLLLNSSAFWITSLSVIEVDSSMLTNSIGPRKIVTQLLYYTNLCSFISMFWILKHCLWFYPLRFSLSSNSENTVSRVWIFLCMYSLFSYLFLSSYGCYGNNPTVMMDNFWVFTFLKDRKPWF